MTAGADGSAVTRPALAPVFAPDGTTTEAAPRTGTSPAAIRLTETLRGYDPKADIGLIDAAYTLAAQAHGTQRRDNGDPYITHSVALADILAGSRLATASIPTGLLHDRIDHTPLKRP